MNENIKNAMLTAGWKEIRLILETKRDNLRLPKNINKDKNYKDVAIEVLGKGYAVRVIDRLLKELDNISANKNVPANNDYR